MIEIKNKTEFIEEIEKQIKRDTKMLVVFIFLNMVNMLLFFLEECFIENMSIINVIWSASALILSIVIALYYVDLFEKNENLKTIMKCDLITVNEEIKNEVIKNE